MNATIAAERSSDTQQPACPLRKVLSHLQWIGDAKAALLFISLYVAFALISTLRMDVAKGHETLEWLQQAHERITSFGGLLRMYREAPPITRTWITGSVFLSVLVAARRVDLRAIGFSERDVLEHGEWWRLLVNFFYMGDQVLSIFYWLQLYHFAECLKVLELVKYRWEPADFVKTILVNAAFLLVLKQFSKSMIFLGSPMVMVFVYLYARTCACAAAAPHAPQFGPQFGPHFGARL